MRRVLVALILAALLGTGAAALAAGPEVRRFATDPGIAWQVFPGPVETVFVTDADSALGCRGTINAYLVFPDRALLTDEARVAGAARDAMRHFADTLCKGEAPRADLPLWGYVRGAYRADAAPFLESGDVQVWLRAVRQPDGGYRIDVQRNLVAEEIARGRQTAARTAKRAAVCRTVTAERAGFAARIGALCAAAGQGGDPLAGVWAESPADCARKAWVLTGSGGGDLEFWSRDPEYGFAPDRAGTWTRRGDMLALALRERFTARPDGAVVREPKPETVQFQIDSLTGDLVKLTGFGGHSGRFALFRCDCSALAPARLPDTPPPSCKAGP